MTDLRLAVRDSAGALVADVIVDPSCSFAEHPGVGFVMGHFTPGPAFPIVAKMLREFTAIVETGDIAAASASHERMDALELRAIDADGNSYRVFNVHFQDGALLFAAVS